MVLSVSQHSLKLSVIKCLALSNLSLKLLPLSPRSLVDTSVLVSTMLSLLLGSSSSNTRLAVEHHVSVCVRLGKAQGGLKLLGSLTQSERLRSKRHVVGSRNVSGTVLAGLSNVDENGVLGCGSVDQRLGQFLDVVVGVLLGRVGGGDSEGSSQGGEDAVEFHGDCGWGDTDGFVYMTVWWLKEKLCLGVR